MPKKRNRGDMGYSEYGGKVSHGKSSGWSNPMGSVGTSGKCQNVVDGNGGVAGSVSLRVKNPAGKMSNTSKGSKHYAGNYTA